MVYIINIYYLISNHLYIKTISFSFLCPITCNKTSKWCTSSYFFINFT